MEQKDIYFAVCDDIEAIRTDLARRLMEIYGNDVDLHLFSTAESLFNFIRHAPKKTGIIFLDIQLGEENGIHEAIRLQKLNPELKIIFMTAYPGYASDIFEARPKDLMMKPIDDEKLRKVLRRVSKAIEEEKQQAVAVRLIGGAVEIILPQAILYVESEKRILHIHEGERVLDSYGKLEELTEQLPNCFLRCHKSYLVNMSLIKRFSTEEIVLRNGEIIPVSRSRKEAVKDVFLNYSRLAFRNESEDK